MYIWLPRYVRERYLSSAKTKPRHLMYLLVDHYEPRWETDSVELEHARVDRWLDELGPKTMPPFTALARSAYRAQNRQEIRNAARALYDWRKAVTHEG